MEEKFGTILLDGKIIDVDSLSLIEAEKLKNRLDQQEFLIMEKINQILN